jgi:hypothetical protein
MSQPVLLTITQGATEGSFIVVNYIDVSDEKAIEHFMSELRQSFLASALPAFRKQLTEMVNNTGVGSFDRRRDPSVQGILTVARALAYTPETLPLVDDVEDEEPELKLYSVRVSEMRDYTRTYTVLAVSEAEATEKAEKGETESESDGILTEISSREAISTPQLIQ